MVVTSTMCVCGTAGPHDCVWDGLRVRLGRSYWCGLPPCEVCGFSSWPAGGMAAARSIHMRAHERNKANA